MLTENARILAIDEDCLWVESIQQTTCKSCSAKSSCGAGLLNKIHTARRNQIRVLFSAKQQASDFQIGDRVVIAIPESLVLKMSLLLYLLPLVGLIAGAALGQYLFEQYEGLVQFIGQEMQSIIFAAVGFVVAICYIRRRAKQSEYDKRLQPVLLCWQAEKVFKPWLLLATDPF